jgi:ketosteroid isomerase-like protein
VKWIYVAALMLTTTACSHLAQEIRMDNAAEVSTIDTLLDRFHTAASQADYQAYFQYFHDDGVFLGTDKQERWTVPAFKAFCEPYFAKGKGWTYTPIKRHIMVSPGGESAWFDEALHNEKYGNTRGSGALIKVAGEWKITQYVLSLPIPNDIALDVVKHVQTFESKVPVEK